jgi:plastocyanin
MRVRFVLATALCAAACGGSDRSPTTPPKTTSVTVDIFTTGNSFSPTFATLDVGDTARFNFATGTDGGGHNVRFTPAVAGAPSDINVLKTGTANRIFNTKGDFKYVCDVHPGMIGEIVVQ